LNARGIVSSILSAALSGVRPAIVLCAFAVFLVSCSDIQKPTAEPFISETSPPKKQEFRWSNGRALNSLDPALATAPPETDIVRAIFEGLTELDPRTLREMPAAAEKWTAADGFRTWTFTLRKNLKWSDGHPVTADDFVRSWKRLANATLNADTVLLTDNISGMSALRKQHSQTRNFQPERTAGVKSQSFPDASNTRLDDRQPDRPKNGDTNAEAAKESPGAEAEFGAKALSDLLLQVNLVNPDKDFPKLVAHPIFSPVAGDGSEFRSEKYSDILGNGPFKISAADPGGVTLIRSEQYWNSDSVQLEQVRFVPSQNAEAALQAYRAGEIDALTNADFEPLALKLLTPYNDFRQSVHNALNFYEFNLAQPPFTDRRIREALTIAVERDRLTEGDLKGSTEPALHLLPFDTEAETLFDEDVDRAKRLFEEAGYPNGQNFPVIRLVVNRNDTQQRIARSVARMWKANLNIETELIVKEPAEMDAVRTSGDFDLIRRGLVFSTVDRNRSMAAIFLTKPDKLIAAGEPAEPKTEENSNAAATTGSPDVLRKEPLGIRSRIQSDPSILESTLEDAVYEFRVVPLYFPVSYSLVKPYVEGFDTNGLDAPSLKTVSINSNWQPNGQ
jgi:oligopeptide transport system substrate-binding protein